jgi:hypothetical protein
MNKILSRLVLVCFVFSMIVGPVAAETANSDTTEQKPFISAEERVHELAIGSENHRKATGLVLVGTAVLMTILWNQAAATDPNGLWATPGYAGAVRTLLGICLVGGGVLAYLIPNGIENDYSNIDKIDKTTDKGKKERALLAERVLKDRSTEAAAGRPAWALFWAGMGVSILTSGGEFSALGLLCGGPAIYEWTTKTEVEKEYEKYMGDKELLKKELSVTPVTNEVTTIEAK